MARAKRIGALSAAAIAVTSLVACGQQDNPQKGKPAVSKASGEGLYAYHCATCHGAGARMPATAALALKYKGTQTPALLTERSDLDRDMITYMVRHGVNAMPNFRKAEISDQELSAITDFLTRKKQ